jgi:hypothetical protein
LHKAYANLRYFASNGLKEKDGVPDGEVLIGGKIF